MTDTSASASTRSWWSMSITHARWSLRTTWRNGEQLLLVVGIPVIAVLVLTRTDFLVSDGPVLAIVAALIVLGSGFTSPAITIAFERRYGSYAFLGTTPLPRSAIIAGTFAAIALTALLSLVIVVGVWILSGASQQATDESPSWVWLAIGSILGLCAVVPWAFALGGTLRSEGVLAVANAIFVLAILFGGVLIPAANLPFGSIVEWLPPGAVVQAASGSSPLAAGTLIAWGALGTVVATRSFRWR